MQTLKEMMIHELLCQESCDPNIKKDIIVIVKDQPDYVKKCFSCLLDNTVNFTLWIWDNGSLPETADYLFQLAHDHDNIYLSRSEANEGFIEPNNLLAKKGEAPYIILLNSDTEVFPGWDAALLGYLQEHPNTGIVGYEGGLLSKDGMGIQPWKGPEVDYVMGWCLALPRKVYDQIGLFDEANLHFAYCEDSDLCLRAQEAGFAVYALNINRVLHHANVTVREVRKKRNLKPEFVANHEYFRERHAQFLAEKRILLGYPEMEAAVMKNANKTPAEVADDFFDGWQSN